MSRVNDTHYGVAVLALVNFLLLYLIIEFFPAFEAADINLIPLPTIFQHHSYPRHLIVYIFNTAVAVAFHYGYGRSLPQP